MATIKQVANAAGVSFKTVSRVINRDPNVRADTRARVQEVIQMMGYRPNLAARQMRSQRSEAIGFITDEIATTPFAVNIIRGAEKAAWEQRYLLLVVDMDSDPQRARDAIEMMLERKVEGIVYATMRNTIITPPANLSEVPTVLANCRVHNDTFASVIPDEISGGYGATEALINAGRRRIGFINLEPNAVASGGRLIGYQRALAAHSIPFDEDLLVYTDGQPDSGYLQAHKLLGLRQPPDAIFCGNDRVAMGTYEAIKEHGLKIPHDVSVVGFDNQDVIAANLRPALSTMALPHEAMGRWAVDYLLRRAHALDDMPVEHVVLPCPYVPRASV
ncbi:MAG: LacI family DNA-binding transcriptional regulator [Chloroflexota bacterium]|nr:LacI family DNA-binding transcriptional regulator [Chloroflexota bacterium]